jgi:hypothetical protein
MRHCLCIPGLCRYIMRQRRRFHRDNNEQHQEKIAGCLQWQKSRGAGDTSLNTLLALPSERVGDRALS